MESMAIKNRPRAEFLGPYMVTHMGVTGISPVTDSCFMGDEVYGTQACD